MRSIPGSGRSPREGNGNPLQDSCLDKRMDRGAWWATVHGVTKSWTRLKQLSTCTYINQITSKERLCGSGDALQCCAMTSTGKESKRVDICICVTASLLFTQSQQNIINQLDPNIFFFKKRNSLTQSSMEPSVATGSNAPFVPGVQGPECPGNFPGDSINPKNS